MTPVDERTRENPESAMCHTELLDVQLSEAYKARSKSANQAYNSAWQMALRKVTRDELAIEFPRSEIEEPEPQHFDTEAHRRFMRGLG